MCARSRRGVTYSCKARCREYERDGANLLSYELRADTIAKLDRVERRQNADDGAAEEPGEV